MKFVYKITIEYNGKNFFGSQSQGSLRTVEKVLVEKIKQLLKNGFDYMFASRTDSGVHALENVVRLRTEEEIELKSFLERINLILPRDLKVRKIKRVNASFNPRKDVKYKVYEYKIFNHKIPPVLYEEYCWCVKYDLDETMLKRAVKIVEGKKKFNFATTKEYSQSGKNTQCNLKIKFYKRSNFFVIKFISKRFLNKMIRNIVSLLIEVARKKMSIDELKKIVKTWDYYKIRPAPAKGLILVRIIY